MSGIAGIIHLDGRPAEPERVRRMVDAAAYRGPDGTSTWTSGPAALGYLKLATTPEALSETQPLVDEEAGVVLVFDGRLDNRDELFEKLGAGSGVPREAPDGEVTLACYRRYGEACPEHLAGDFAFAVWDTRERRLFSARSLCGRRPLLWACDGRTFVFGSDPVQLFASGCLEKRLNEGTAAEVLSLRFMTPDETLWAGVRRLSPGCCLSVRGGEPRIWRWHTGPFPELKLKRDEEYVERFSELFDQALRSCFRSSTPVAAHLSGGLDSSSIVCRAWELYQDGALDRCVQPVSMVFPGKPWDEIEYIEAAVRRTGVETLRVTPLPYDWTGARRWSRATHHLPIRPNSAPLDHASELRRRGIRVLLSGLGGDEWLAGTYAHWADLLRQGRAVQLCREWKEATKGASPIRAMYLLGSNGLGPWVRQSVRRAVLHPEIDPHGAVPDWIRPEWALRVGLMERAYPAGTLPALSGFAQMERYQAFIRARPHVLLDNVLCHAVSEQVEVRDPFNDRRLAEFILGIPGGMLRRGPYRKYILREAMRDTLPKEICRRTTKARFTGVISEALEEMLTRDKVEQLAPVRAGWVDGGLLWQRFMEHQEAAGRGDATPDGSHVAALWAAVALDLWLSEAVGGS